MRRIYDITDKLTFAEPPVIKIKNVELTVDDSATTAIELMAIIGNGDSMASADIEKCAELLFGKEGYKKVKKLNLNLTDFTTLVMESSTLIIGGDEQGETREMPDMI